MASDLIAELVFTQGCPDCGKRQVSLPPALPDIGNDFDWLQRDYDGFRIAMMEYLAAAFPERRRWTPADVEITLIEALAAILDQLSDQLDRVAAESYLETARRPQTVRRFLKLIGFDALNTAVIGKTPPFDKDPAPGDGRSNGERLDQYWLDFPHTMDVARWAGPRSIRVQRRMVTVADYTGQLGKHPLVYNAHAWSEWDGSWTSVYAAVILMGARTLEETVSQEIVESLIAYYAENQLDLIQWKDEDDNVVLPTFRAVLTQFIEQWRMLGQEVKLVDAQTVGIEMAISVQVDPRYFQSEVKSGIDQALGGSPQGFFAPGRLRFGEDLHASDIFQVLMGLEGVQNVCLNRFKRVGSFYPNHSEDGRIELKGIEVAVCDNDPLNPQNGYYRFTMHGGLKG